MKGLYVRCTNDCMVLEKNAVYDTEFRSGEGFYASIRDIGPNSDGLRVYLIMATPEPDEPIREYLVDSKTLKEHFVLETSFV